MIEKPEKVIYFDVWNGVVIDPNQYSPPYSAVVKGMKVLELRACFAKANIKRSGDAWALNQILKSREEWSSYPWLLPSLKKFMAFNYFREEWRDFENELAENYEYIPFLDLREGAQT